MVFIYTIYFLRAFNSATFNCSGDTIYLKGKNETNRPQIDHVQLSAGMKNHYGHFT